MESRWIWPFELLDKLGEGGMGVVYRARYVGNNRQVAVKLIPDEITADATALARFERELDLLTQLKHPNIVHCFGGSCATKQRFYAMEYVPGGTLAEHLQEKGRLNWETAVDFAIQICAALQYAHEHGVIHRDIKPGNFLMTKTGQLKLSDFGLASVVSAGRLTAAGRTVGTILYMAPEQIRGGSINHQADLYGLGCVIYEMLAGTPPFSGSSAAEVLQKHLKEPPPHVVRTVLNCPLELDSLICELLSKSPEHRPATAADVSNRLNGILLPSRNGNHAEPMLFATQAAIASTKTVAIAAKKPIPESNSDWTVPTRSRPAAVTSGFPWVITVIALLFCSQLWFLWTQAATQLKQAEQIWIGLLESTDPQTQILAARALGKFDLLSPTAIGRLSSAATSPVLEVRLAALKSLTKHAAECRPIRAELIRIQKVDENNQVRTEAALAVEAIQRSSNQFAISGYALGAVGLTFVASVAAAFWWVWHKVHPYAQ